MARRHIEGVKLYAEYCRIQISRVEIGGNSSSATQPSSGSSLYIDDLKANTSAVGAFSAAGNANIYKSTGVTWTAKTLFEDGTRIATTSASTLGEITGPNNWYMDTSANIIYAWLPSNANPNSHTMEASRRDKLFDLSNRSYLTVSGLTLQYNRQNSSASGGMYLSSSTNNTIQNNTVKDNFGSGIYLISSTNNTISSNTILRNMRTFGGGIRLENGSNTNTISSNTITGENSTAGNGIFFCGDDTCGTTGNNTNDISGNTISEVQDTCIYFDTNNDSNTIQKNICHDSRVDTSDSTKGGNGIHIALGSDDNSIQNNLVYNMARHGISIRDGNTSQGYVSNYRNIIDNNTVYNVGTNGTGNGIDVQGTNPNTVIKNNISVLLGTGTAPINIESASTSTVTSDYNILYNTASGGRIAKWNGTNYTSLAAYQTAANQDAHSNSSDPQFANTSSNNYQLQSSSPAIDSGVTISSVTTDLLGVSRPQKCSYDIGAYEFVASCSSNSATTSSSSNETGSGPADPNFPIGYAYRIMTGPHFFETLSFISGTSGAENALAFVNKNASVHDLYISITKPTLRSFFSQTPNIPFPWQQRINTAGDMYSFHALAAFNGMQITNFDKAVTIVLPYDPKRLSKIKPSQLRIAMYDSKKKVWKFLPGAIVNTKNHTLATTVKSFSYFVVGYKK